MATTIHPMLVRGERVTLPMLEAQDALRLPAALHDAQRGAHSAFAELVKAEQNRVFSLAYRMIRDREQAHDLAQEAFLQLYRHLLDIESIEHMQFWLRRVVTNLSIDKLRRIGSKEWVSLDAVSDHATEDHVNYSDPLLANELNSLLEDLPANARAVVLLRYQEDLGLTDIARTMNMPVNTVKSHLKRSLALLKKKLSRLSQVSKISPIDGERYE